MIESTQFTGEHIEITFQQVAAAGDLIYQVWISQDTQAWSLATVLEISRVNQGNMDPVTLRIQNPLPGSKKLFVKFSVDYAP